MKIKAVALAKELGLSKSTVSLVLNGKPGVREETRERVLACRRAMEEGSWKKGKYIRLAVFSRVGRGRTGAEFSNVFFLRCMEGVEREVAKKGYRMEVCFLSGCPEAEQFVEECGRGTTAGVLLLATFMEKGWLEAFRQLPVPCVIYDNDLETIHFDQVLANNGAAVRAAVRHLVESGCRRIFYLSSGGAGMYNLIQRDRMAELMAAECRKKNISLELVPQENITALLRDRVVTEKHASGAVPGLLCSNGGIYSRLFLLLEESGLRVPEDVSLIGIDPPEEKMKNGTELTCLDMRDYYRGAFAVKRLVEQIEGSVTEVMTTLIAPDFIRGGTVKGEII